MPPSSRRTVVRLAQAAAVAVVLGFAAASLGEQWTAFRRVAAALEPRWGGVVGSALLVLATYALLVLSWRTLVRASGDHLSVGDATRIWAVSNLGRYVPGRIWSIGAMGLLAQRAGVSPATAAGAAVVGTVVNLAAGFLVLFLAGTDVVRALFPAAGGLVVLLPLLGIAGLLATPLLVPAAARTAARVLKRPYTPMRLPVRALALVAAANAASWVGYGVAFRWLAVSLVPSSPGDWVAYVAVFAGSYLAGYLALVVPGGLVVRELSMTAGLVQLHLADEPTAALLAVASRLWLTALELLPGLLFLARDASRSAPRPTSDVPV